MPRRETPFIPDQYYHFYNRGNNRQAVFFEPKNYVYFLKSIKKYLRGKVEIIAYCLMPTHYHILARVLHIKTSFKNLGGLEQRDDEVRRFLHQSHQQAFRPGGSLFQGQFQAKPVKTDKHLLNLCAYIHANPVKDGLAPSPEMWDFSNYLEWMGLRNGTLVNREFITENFGTAEEYGKFVTEYIRSRKMDEEFQNYIRDFER
ncbi:MAG: transposase [Anaerolineaceae bacterium]|jgi:REP element-mobilizing transposase RayT|nr:MAG: transposase [Anaerolineaceae bacterium]